ncbi:MAG: hypothetical protein ABI675_21390 [Chitinophagaceae bacterium]
MKITAAQLTEYLQQQGYFIITKNKAEITLEETGIVSLTLPIDAGNDRNIIIDLVITFNNVQEFIETTWIRNVDDLQQIKSSSCWSQYILGCGYISCQLLELKNADLCFRLPAKEIRNSSTSMTMVYSEDIHFYDTVEKALTLPEQFYKLP